MKKITMFLFFNFLFGSCVHARIQRSQVTNYVEKQIKAEFDNAYQSFTDVAHTTLNKLLATVKKILEEGESTQIAEEKTSTQKDGGEDAPPYEADEETEEDQHDHGDEGHRTD